MNKLQNLPEHLLKTDTSTLKRHWLFSHLLQAARDPLSFFNYAREYGADIIPSRVGWTRVLLLNHPNYIEEVFSQQNRMFMRKGHFLRNNSKLLLGNGLFLSEGKFYQHQRKLAQPAFHKQMITSYGEVMVEETNRVIATWQDGQKRDVYQEFVGITMSIIAKTMLGTELAPVAANIVTTVLDATMNRFVNRMNALFLVPNWFPTPGHLRFRRAVKQLDQVVYDIINQRCTNEKSQGNFLDLLIYAQQKEGGQITLQQLRDEVINIFLAGHESTAIALTWTSYLLSQHPSVEAKLIEELQTVLRGRTPTVADLPQLRYTEAIALEALRLYPPVWLMERVALEDTEISGYSVAKGTRVFAVPWSAHRNPEFFPEPEKFNPSRWEDGLAKRIPLGAYFPFSLGERSCIGKDFGMMEIVLLIATIFQNFQLKLVPGHPVEIFPSLTLRPKHGMKMLLTKR
ncbi:cytochrome P450 [Nostoc sp. ChiQUE01b]|uniref:cytochrome P450 n=1 Tax=Nostoc sp. ChiQUE01b TaxID=3075376 RepID=UPI002AD32F55|nr:cytochrome P450 [Nostoc sp. ChiQUE01b]MDZ8258128.1 cytochrome P450 [Nostoc sp. ChiQUE01b]